VLDPAGIISKLVTPSGFELVAEGPQEVTSNVVIESLNGALTDVVDGIVIEPGGVKRAHAFLDNRALVGTKRTKFSGSSVEINSKFFRKVRVGALGPLAVVVERGVVVVESTEPEGANISSERPLTNPDVVFNSFSGSLQSGSVVIAVGLFRAL